MSQEVILEQLKKQVATRVRLTFSDGEIVVADLDLVLEDEEAVILDLTSSNRPEKYRWSDGPPHIFANVADITSCKPECG